ncbi:MAG: hypothetical protein NC293_09895 [Roseburia sp.]|nr:hypothetical protein [Roseburia sp.]
MKKFLVLFIIMSVFFIGCSTTDKETVEINNNEIQEEETSPVVENIPNCPWWEQKMLEEGTNFSCNVTKDRRYTYLYGYKEKGKQKYMLADLTEQNEWEMNPAAWEEELWEKTEEVLTDLAVCPDGSYIGVVQPVDDLPVFYELKEDGEVLEWKLPKGTLTWKTDKYEKVDWITVNEKNQIVIATYFANQEYELSGDVFKSIASLSRVIVYDRFQKKIMTEREYVGSKERICMAGEYIFSGEPEGEYMGIRVYRMDGGGTQAVISHDTFRKAEYSGGNQQNYVCYGGGDYGYWYTDFGIYRFPVKETYDGSEELELVIPSDSYVRNDRNYNLTDFMCTEGDLEVEFYIKIIEHIQDENGNWQPGDVILTRYVE